MTGRTIAVAIPAFGRGFLPWSTLGIPSPIQHEVEWDRRLVGYPDRGSSSSRKLAVVRCLEGRRGKRRSAHGTSTVKVCRSKGEGLLLVSHAQAMVL